jgi:hypothetical protein
MSENEFQDLLIECKGMVIVGKDESIIRDELRNRGVSSEDALRVLAALDFGEQVRSRRRDLPYRVGGALALLVGLGGALILYHGAEPNTLYRAFAGLAVFGLYFAVLGGDGIIWRD